MNRRSRPRAFTLLELLAASALAAVMMVVMLQVIAALSRDKVALDRKAAADDWTPWQRDLVESLRWDLSHAAEGTAEPNLLKLTGHGALDQATLAPLHRPVTVSYRIEQLGDRSWLVRRQTPRGGAAGGGGWSELVCPDVTRFVLEPVEERESDPLWASIRPRRPRGPVPIDASTRAVRLRFDGPSGVIVDRVLVLR